MKEFGLEVMRDRASAVVICSIENIDPMGVTGDSVTWRQRSSRMQYQQITTTPYGASR
jgi:carbamoylphosphate synthase large subunit